jgi:hypothetical protein
MLLTPFIPTEETTEPPQANLLTATMASSQCAGRQLILEGLSYLVPVIGTAARNMGHQHPFLPHLSGLGWPLCKLSLSGERLCTNTTHAALFLPFFSIHTFFPVVFFGLQILVALNIIVPWCLILRAMYKFDIG